MSQQRFKKVSIALVVSVALMLSTVGTVWAKRDIDGHWAAKHMDKWIAKNLLKGYEDGSYRPDALATRAEFIAMVNRCFGFAKSKGYNFKDVAGGEWFANEIAKAVAAGYINGYPDGSMKPNDYITRQEVAVVLARILELARGEDRANLFSDAKDMPDWAKWAIGAIAREGYANGYPDNSFKPHAKITRAELITMLSRIAEEIYNQPGLQGDKMSRKITSGSVVINAAGVTLENMLIKKNLIIAGAVADGDVYLKDVTVLGTIIISGGTGGVTFENVTAGSVKVNGKDIPLTLVNSKVGLMLVNEDASGLTVSLDDQSRIATVTFNATASVTGTGSIGVANIKVPGVTIEPTPEHVILAEGVTADIGGDGDQDSESEVQVSEIVVTSQSGETTISTPGGTLQLVATVLPEDAADKSVTWTVLNGTGEATVSEDGLVTAVKDGTVKVRATANDGSNIYGEIEIVISGQAGPN